MMNICRNEKQMDTSFSLSEALIKSTHQFLMELMEEKCNSGDMKKFRSIADKCSEYVAIRKEYKCI